MIPLGTYVHVSPNPFGDDAIDFEAADTGGAIVGKHIDIYDWRGRAAQDAWGARQVSVTPGVKTGAGNVLESTPSATLEGAGGEPAEAAGCETDGAEGPLPLTPGQTAKVLPDGLAAAPAEAPEAVKAMIAAGNRLDHASYLYGGGHGPSLDTLQPAYDCSSSVSYVLHGGGVFGTSAEDSTELESYGEPGPGKWVTVYANSEHAFMYVAGIRFDTSYNGTDVGPNEGQSGPRWRVFRRSTEMGSVGGPPPTRTVKGRNMRTRFRRYLLLLALVGTHTVSVGVRAAAPEQEHCGWRQPDSRPGKPRGTRGDDPRLRRRGSAARRTGRDAAAGGGTLRRELHQLDLQVAGGRRGAAGRERCR